MGTARFFLSGIFLSALSVLPALGATQYVDLDGQSANGSESQCDLNVLQTFPVKIENKITNKAIDAAFNFAWKSAGPGGFTSSVTAGTASGVGAKWVWTTNQTVYAFTGSSCAGDLCFGQTAGPGPINTTCSLSCIADGAVVGLTKGAAAGEVVLNWTGGQGPFIVYRSASKVGVVNPSNAIGNTDLRQVSDVSPAGSIFFYLVRGVDCTARKPCASDLDCEPVTEGTCVNRGPFGVPGRSLFSNDVTVSSASLTSSLITFFSPPSEIFRVTSSAAPGGLQETLTNNTGAPITVVTQAYPPGCCPVNPSVPDQLRCGEICVDYLNDPENCGACGNACAEGSCCSNGVCESFCEEGRTWCDGACVDLQNDDAHCGECNSACGDGTCCFNGICASVCGDGEDWCGGLCSDLQSDSNNCGACGNVCEDGTCCTGGTCAPVCGEGQTWCDGLCVDIQDDNSNCGTCGNNCGEGTCCWEGACASVCDEGRSWCDGQCAELQNDPTNCGACGNNCGDGSCCVEGVCASACYEGETWCDGYCSNLQFDTYNCGACGNTCDEGSTCDYGECVACEGEYCGGVDEPTARLGEGSVCDYNYPSFPVEGVCPNQNPSEPSSGACPIAGLGIGICPNPNPTSPVGGYCPSPERSAPFSVGGTPNCQTEGGTTTIPPGGSVTTCAPGALVYREVPTIARVCGEGIPGPDGSCAGGISRVSEGTFMRFVPDASVTIGDAYVTPYAVHVTNDTSGDGMLSPGENANLFIRVLNAGPVDLTGANATLVSPVVDLTDDGLSNPTGVTITAGSSPYGTIPGTAPSVNCEPQTLSPASNMVPFQLTLPPDHPGDTSRPFVLQFNGTVSGSPFSMNVPIALGIADRCVFGAATGDFDGVDGLRSPMAKLVPAGDPVAFPPSEFSAGSTRPLRLQMSCGGVNLTAADVDAPEIVALSEETRGPLDIRNLNLNDDNAPNRNDPFFRWNSAIEGGQWTYNMRTALIGTGRFTITIRLASRKEYVTGFVLR